MATLFEQAEQQFTVFTRHATALESALNRSEMVSNEQLGAALDNSRAWVMYLAPGGALQQGVSLSAAPELAVAILARINEFQRLAQQWVDFFEPRLQAQPTAQHGVAQDEQACLNQIAQAEQRFRQQEFSFSMGADASSDQIDANARSLGDFLVQVIGLRAATAALLSSGRPLASQRLDALIQSIGSMVDALRASAASRRAFEFSQRQSGG